MSDQCAAAAPARHRNRPLAPRRPPAHPPAGHFELACLPSGPAERRANCVIVFTNATTPAPEGPANQMCARVRASLAGKLIGTSLDGATITSTGVKKGVRDEPDAHASSELVVAVPVELTS